MGTRLCFFHHYKVVESLEIVDSLRRNFSLSSLVKSMIDVSMSLSLVCLRFWMMNFGRCRVVGLSQVVPSFVYKGCGG